MNSIDPIPLLEGPRIRLRAYDRSDLETARQFLNNLETRALMAPGILFPLKAEDETKWYESFGGMSEGVYNFAIERIDTKTYIGGCGINEIDQKSRVGTVGIFLGAPHQNHGFGTEAMQLLVDFCFREMNLQKVKLRAFAFNQRAIRCYEKIGFQTEGVLKKEVYRNGAYQDEVLMAVFRDEWKIGLG
jgi:RimJ/RimL family protein N-acetyltransferase